MKIKKNEADEEFFNKMDKLQKSTASRKIKEFTISEAKRLENPTERKKDKLLERKSNKYLFLIKRSLQLKKDIENAMSDGIKTKDFDDHVRIIKKSEIFIKRVLLGWEFNHNNLLGVEYYYRIKEPCESFEKRMDAKYKNKKWSYRQLELDKEKDAWIIAIIEQK